MDTEKPEPKNEADETFVHFIKLSEIVGEVLRRLYSCKSKAIGYGKKEVENVVEFLRGMLNDWRRQLPERLNISDLELASMRSNFSSDITPDKTYCDKGRWRYDSFDNPRLLRTLTFLTLHRTIHDVLLFCGYSAEPPIYRQRKERK